MQSTKNAFEQDDRSFSVPAIEDPRLIDAMPMHIWVLLDPGRFGAVNSAWAEYLGVKKEDLENRFIRDVLPEEEADLCIRGNEKVFRNKKALHTEEWIVNACGRRRLLAVTKKPVLDDAGTVVYVICMAEDVTEQRRTEDAVCRLDAILDAVRFAAIRLLRKTRWSDEIPGVLQRLGEATDMSRVRLFEIGDIEGPRPGRWEWTGTWIMPLGTHLSGPADLFTADETPQWYADLATGRPVIARAGEFPEKAQKNLSSAGIVSLVEIPIIVAGEWWGCLCLDDCRCERYWTDVEIDALVTTARIIGAAIERNRLDSLYRLPVISSSSAIYLAQDDTLTYVNPAFSTVFGYQEEEVAGQMHPADVVLPEDRSLLQKIISDILSGENSSSRHEIRGRRKDGRLLPLEHFGTRTHYRGRPAVLGIFVDRSAQKETEAALAGNGEKYRELINNARDGIYLVKLTDENMLGEVIEVNPAACISLQYCREEFLQMSFGDLEDHQSESEKTRRMELLLLHGEVTCESVFVKKDRSVMPAEVKYTLFELAEKPVVLAVARDITERKERQKKEAEAFRQIERNMEQFAILNDHIRNPLQVILGLAALYDEEVGDRIATEVRRIDALVNNLDQGWLQSEKIRAVLRRHYGMFQDGTAEWQAN